MVFEYVKGSLQPSPQQSYDAYACGHALFEVGINLKQCPLVYSSLDVVGHRTNCVNSSILVSVKKPMTFSVHFDGILKGVFRPPITQYLLIPTTNLSMQRDLRLRFWCHRFMGM